MINTQYQVMLVDDSAVARGLFSRWLEEDNSIHVAAYAANGQQALKELVRHELDVIVLDIDMPIMDGMQALPKILQARPDIKIIMACTPSHHDAEISLKALQAGASDYVLKPTNSQSLRTDLDFRRDMIEKIKALASARRRQLGTTNIQRVSQTRTVNSAGDYNRKIENDSVPRVEAGSSRLYSNQKIQLRPQSKAKPAILAIGSSTGGPQALFTMFSALTGKLNIPVVITQHMPADFTSILSEHLSRVIDGICKEGKDGEELIAGNVYLAPGGHHMLVEKRSSRTILRITMDPPENFCRPAVDPMMRSLTKVYQDQVLAVILTGMGQDGLKGCQALTSAGSTLIAQDEATSVVWGMPGAVATNGLCSAILPIDKIGPMVAKVLAGGQL